MSRVRVIILGQGMVAAHLAVGLERIRSGEIETYGIPLANHPLPYRVEDIEIAASYDVDTAKVGQSLYQVAHQLIGDSFPIPEALKEISVLEGVHLGSLRGMPMTANGLEERMTLSEAVEHLVEEWKRLNADVFVNIICTEPAKPFPSIDEIRTAIENNARDRISASQLYAYAVALYAQRYKPAAFINGIPVPLANDSAMVTLYEQSRAVLFGDDGATGATPLTCDVLEHMAQRNRRVRCISQFNIGGNTDFLALTIPERNIMKETTKSGVVSDILGYEVPNYIKPTGYLPPLGDKKFVAMHIEYVSFNGVIDELFINARINDSPALAGTLIDLIRLGKLAIDHQVYGTIYEVNAFYMKRPGPSGTKATSKIYAFYNLLRWLEQLGYPPPA